MKNEWNTPVDGRHCIADNGTDFMSQQSIVVISLIYWAVHQTDGFRWIRIETMSTIGVKWRRHRWVIRMGSFFTTAMERGAPRHHSQFTGLRPVSACQIASYGTKFSPFPYRERNCIPPILDSRAVRQGNGPLWQEQMRGIVHEKGFLPLLRCMKPQAHVW